MDGISAVIIKEPLERPLTPSTVLRTQQEGGHLQLLPGGLHQKLSTLGTLISLQTARINFRCL